jgi:hypothetical protein
MYPLQPHPLLNGHDYVDFENGIHGGNGGQIHRADATCYMIFDVAENWIGFVPRKNCDIGVCGRESENVAFLLIGSGSD